jgi:hypothetical protein
MAPTTPSANRIYIIQAGFHHVNHERGVVAYEPYEPYGPEGGRKMGVLAVLKDLSNPAAEVCVSLP